MTTFQHEGVSNTSGLSGRMRAQLRNGCRGLVMALLLFMAASPARAQAWSRGIQDLTISTNECMERAALALQAEGYGIGTRGDGFIAAIKGIHTAVIMCNAGSAGRTWVNIVVVSCGASDGGIPGTERVRLQQRMENAAPGGGASASGAAACTPAGIWNWVDNATTVINADGTVTHTAGYTARWQSSGQNRYLFTWNNGAIDTLTLSSDGRAMDGTNNFGQAIHVTCAKSGGGTPASTGMTLAGGVCTPAGIWNWVDNATAVINADGTVTHTAGYTARWQSLGQNRYLFTWNNGAIDTLTLSSDGRAMDGTNNFGQAIHVTCGAAGVPPGGQTGGGCADPRTLATMDQWLASANPPENQRPGWSVRYEAWGRLVGNTPTNTLAVNGPPDTRLSRCEWLWSISTSLRSTNLGTLRDYLQDRLR